MERQLSRAQRLPDDGALFEPRLPLRRAGMSSEGHGIEVNGLRKDYRVHRRKTRMLNTVRSVFRGNYETVPAVNDLSFRVEPGERVGCLGPNGAGKTTTLKILSGLLQPAAGRVAVAGHEPRLREHRF